VLLFRRGFLKNKNLFNANWANPVMTCSIPFFLGAAFLIVPTLAIGLFGVDSYTSTRLMAQLFGTAMLALDLLLWFVKDVPNEAIQRGMAVAMLVGALAGLFVTALGAFTGTLRTNGWISIVSYVILGAGYALILFLKRGTSQ
jgi:hypothetical protein